MTPHFKATSLVIVILCLLVFLPDADAAPGDSVGPGVVHIDIAHKEVALCGIADPSGTILRCYFLPTRVWAQASEDCLMDLPSMDLRCGDKELTKESH